MNPALIYRILRSYCHVGLLFYFRKWQVKGKEKVPAKGPLLFIANHQNAFLDAILMTCSGSRSPYYLARANVFQKPLAAKFLSSIHLKPIYRFRDGFSTLKNNDIIMQDCIDLMKKGEVILLFPEANHNEPWSMRAFQKGFARMAMMFHEQTNGAPLQIVPIGIHYMDHHAFNTRVLVEYGDPLLVSDLIKDEPSERRKLEAIVEAGEKAIKALALDLKPEEEYKKRKEHLVTNRIYKTDMVEQLEADRRVAAAYPMLSTKKSGENILIKLFRAVLGAYVYLTHGLPYLLITKFIRKNIKDPQFISSVKFAMGIFATPVYYIMLTMIFYLITANGQWSLAFLISLPLSLVIFKQISTQKP